MLKIIAGVLVIVAIGAYFFAQNTTAPTLETQTMQGNQPADSLRQTEAPAKEFAMTSYYDDQGAWFSLKEITVKQGDRVRIKVTNTKGTHDFTVDEFGIKKVTPLNEETVIEFVADKAGTFEYYCSMPGHRARGQLGKLIIME